MAEVDKEHDHTLLHWAAFHGDTSLTAKVLALASTSDDDGSRKERLLSAKDSEHATHLRLAAINPKSFFLR